MATGIRPPPVARRKPLLAGLRARLAFILGVVLVPAFLYSLYQAADAYYDRRAQHTAAIVSVLRVVAAYEDEYFQKTRAALARLAQDAEVRGGRQPACAERLGEVRRQNWDFDDLVVMSAQGVGVCATSEALLAPLWGADLLRALGAGADVALDDMAQSPDSAQSIVVAVPVREQPSGTLTGAVGAVLSLRTFKTAIDNLDLPPDGVAYLLDARGRAVAEPGDGDGRGPSPELVSALLEAPGDRVTTADVDGVSRDYMISDIAGQDIHVVVGVPSLRPFAWLRQELVIGIFAPTLMLALAVVTIWIASDYLVNRHVRSLAAAARAYSRGNLDLRLDLASAPEEFQELARTFARMADRIQRREDDLRHSLAQKELLLREVHHRVKNNLQIVTSLLNLRAQRLQSLEARDAVRQAQMRIGAMTLVHRNLYEQENIQEIELKEFLADLCALLEEADLHERSTVRLELDIEPTRVPTDQATPLALLVTEGVTNAFKHAYRPEEQGRVLVRLTHDDGRARLLISDDGIGLAGFGRGSSGVGITLMHMLAKQLGGKLVLAETSGTSITVDFPIEAARRTAPTLH